MIELLGKWKEKATQYFDVRVQLAKLKFIKATSKVLSSFMLGLVFLMVTMVIFLFIGYGVMETYSHWLDSRIAGAFCTAGTFILLLLIVFAARTSIINSLSGVFIRIMTENDDEDDDDEAA